MVVAIFDLIDNTINVVIDTKERLLFDTERKGRKSKPSGLKER